MKEPRNNKNELNPEWYKNAFFYGIEVQFFFDGNNDGIGDFVGLTEKLDYLKSIGVDCIWLLPFFPSGGRDNGYDVKDFYNIDPDYGTMEDFKKFVSEAKKRGIRVIIDLVVHHTSDLHPWFIESTKSPKSKYRDYYVWSKEVPKGNYPESVPAFPGIEAGVWKYHGVAKEFYFHRFYTFQPDLNVANPKVQEEILNIMKFWLDTGISGFRVDAVFLLFERKGKRGTEVKNAAQFMEKMNRFVKKNNPEGILLAEADIDVNQIRFFSGEGKRMNLLYNFLLNRYVFLSLARGDARAMRSELDLLPQIDGGQWMNFLRNLDELNIDKLTPSEKKEVFEAFGRENYMRIYDRGIRRRLAAMFEGDRNRLKMAYSLLFSLPGSPMIVYGDEIGMADFLDLPEREAVRIPMQWDSSPNAGFTKVPEQGIIRAVLKTGPFKYEEVNVLKEGKNKDSLYKHIKKLSDIREKYPHIGFGKYQTVDTDPGNILAMMYEYKGEMLFIVHNLSSVPSVVKFPNMKRLELEEIFSDDEKYENGKTSISISLKGYGYRWFKVKN